MTTILDIALKRCRGEICLDPSILVVTWPRAGQRRKIVLPLSQRSCLVPTKSRIKTTLVLIIPIGRTHVTIVQHGQCTLVGQNSYEPMTYFIIIDRSLMFFDDA